MVMKPMDSSLPSSPSSFSSSSAADNDDVDHDAEWVEAELQDMNDDDDDAEEDWISDREKAKLRRHHVETMKRQVSGKEGRTSQVQTVVPSTDNENENDDGLNKNQEYTDEEEELVRAMGGKKKAPKRIPGYLGDSTLKEIASDYQVPVAYLADVLCTWGVPVPIHIHDRLGDLVTGEQAFAILEAVNTLDNAALQDRYSDFILQDLCDHYELDLKEVFEFVLTEGWNLPFGVRTCLRVEQEDEVLRLFGGY